MFTTKKGEGGVHDQKGKGDGGYLQKRGGEEGFTTNKEE